MNTATATQSDNFDPDGCRTASLMLTLIQEGPWHELELTDALDTLVLLSRGHAPKDVAEAISQSSGRLRGYGYVRSVRKRAADALTPKSVEEAA